MSKKRIQNSDGAFQFPDLMDNRAFILTLMAAQLLVILLVLFRQGLNVDWHLFIRVTLYVQWQVICCVLLLTQLCPLMKGMSKNQGAILSFSIVVVINSIMALSVQWAVSWLNHASFDWPFVINNMLMSFIVVGMALRYLFVQQSLIQREKAVLEASLLALQARIRPHFLFNTMNSIVSLISFAPDKAERMVVDLSCLLRASLKEESVETDIAQEWQLCERYLAIEKLRLDGRLRWSSDFSNVDTRLPIPSLSLQPIIENAIYHGIQPSPEKGFIDLRVYDNKGVIEIVVTNSQSKTHQSARANRGNEIAIANIRDRIKKLYGEASELSLIDLGDTFEVRLCYQPNKENNNEL